MGKGNVQENNRMTFKATCKRSKNYFRIALKANAKKLPSRQHKGGSFIRLKGNKVAV